MWNNQLSIVNSETLSCYAQVHGINYIIPYISCCNAPTGNNSLSSKVNISGDNAQYSNIKSKPA